MLPFEDAVVAAAPEQTRSDRVVTRNVHDFEQSPVPAVTPRELVAELEAPESRVDPPQK